MNKFKNIQTTFFFAIILIQVIVNIALIMIVLVWHQQLSTSKPWDLFNPVKYANFICDPVLKSVLI